MKDVCITLSDQGLEQAEYADCVILTKDGRILLQKRPEDWGDLPPGSVCLFGGRIEDDESVDQAVCRELEEELGLLLRIQDLECLGLISEIIDGVETTIAIYFFHDVQGQIEECYEGDMLEFESVYAIVCDERVMDYTRFIFQNMTLPTLPRSD